MCGSGLAERRPDGEQRPGERGLVSFLPRQSTAAQLLSLSPPHSFFFAHTAMRSLPLFTLSALSLLSSSLVSAQGDDGSISGPTSSPQAAGYSCDPTKCKLPSCNCASTSPPGGLNAVSIFFLSLFRFFSEDIFLAVVTVAGLVELCIMGNGRRGRLMLHGVRQANTLSTCSFYAGPIQLRPGRLPLDISISIFPCAYPFWHNTV
jgi:hypothetical protein